MNALVVLMLAAVQVAPQADSILILTRPLPTVNVEVPAPIVNVTVEDSATAAALERIDASIARAIERCSDCQASAGGGWIRPTLIGAGFVLGIFGAYQLKRIADELADSRAGPPGRDGRDGRDGEDGQDGQDGAPGDPGGPPFGRGRQR